MIESFDPKRGVRLVRNPRFREWSPAAQPAGYPDEIALRFVADQPAQVEAMKRNEADYLNLFPPDVAPSLRKDGYGSRLHVDPGLSTFYLFLNTRLAPFDNVDVRRALNFAVDRDKLVALRGGPDVAQSSCQVLAPNFAGYARYCPYAHDLAKAKRLVAASGTTGQAVTVWMPEIRKTTGDYLVSVLQSLGYKAKLKVIGEKVPALLPRPGGRERRRPGRLRRLDPRLPVERRLLLRAAHLRRLQTRPTRQHQLRRVLQPGHRPRHRPRDRAAGQRPERGEPALEQDRPRGRRPGTVGHDGEQQAGQLRL